MQIQQVGLLLLGGGEAALSRVYAQKVERIGGPGCLKSGCRGLSGEPCNRIPQQEKTEGCGGEAYPAEKTGEVLELPLRMER